MGQAHPNKTRMQAAVARWIAEAQGRDNGAELLNQRAEWMEQQLRELARTAEKNKPAPIHLRGLTAVDLIEAQGDLASAAIHHRRAA